MTLSYHVDEETEILYWKSVGSDTEEHWDRICGEAIARLNSSPRLNALIDHREHDPMPTDYVKKLISTISPPRHGTKRKLGLVVKEGVTYGVGRLASAHLEIRGIQAKLFLDYSSAEEWLKDRDA